MQSLEVISINLWQIIISLANLYILFLIIKKFLYQPVNKMLKNREEALSGQFNAANESRKQAEASRDAWNDKLKSAEDEAETLILSATETAKARSNEILANTLKEAQEIVRRAEEEASLVHKKAEENIKQEIVYVSTALAEKILRREVNVKDHRALIDSFIEEIGDDNGRAG